MDMICLHNKFHMPSSNGPLVIATKPKTECMFHAAAMVFYDVQTTTLIKMYFFLRRITMSYIVSVLEVVSLGRYHLTTCAFRMSLLLVFV